MRMSFLSKFLVLAAAFLIAGCPSQSAPAEGTGAAEGSAAVEGTAAAAEGTAAAAEGTAAAAEGTAAAAEGTAAAAADGSGGSDFAGPVTVEMLHGTWNVDFARSMAAAEMSEEERAMAMALMGSMQMSITFAADGTMTMNATMMGENKTESGSYRIVSTSANTITIETTSPAEGSGAPETEGGTIIFDSPTSARIQPEGETALFMTKAS
jgi:hypothetical protein